MTRAEEKIYSIIGGTHARAVELIQKPVKPKKRVCLRCGKVFATQNTRRFCSECTFANKMGYSKRK